MRVPRHAPSLPVSALAVFALAGCASPSDDAAPAEHAVREAQPIVNGQTDTGHPYTVALTVQGQAFCSGTLVSPTVVVTAAHCIFPGIGVDPPEAIEVFFGTDVAQGGAFVPVIDGMYNPTWDINDPNADKDVAVLRLGSAAPAPWIRMGKAPKHGEPVTLVGFGITSAGGSGAGTKRVATATIATLFPSIFEMNIDPEGTCNGDSGGTAIHADSDGDSFVGIHTRSDCMTGMIDERVDAHIDDFIQPWIDVDATCALDDGCAMGCAAPDPDCPCAADGHCTADCADVASDPDCDPKCAPDGTCATDCPVPDPDCPVCVADGACVDGCTDDPDCGAGGAGGATAASTAAATGGGGSGDDGGDGCSCREAPPGDGHPATVMVALAGALAARRRRSK